MLALVGLSGCEVEQRAPLPSAPSGPQQMCPRIYQPVCAGRFGRDRTFANSCEARAAGYSIQYGGECQAGPNGPGAGPRPGGQYGGGSGGGSVGTPGSASGGQGSGQMCAMIFKPVCGQRGGDTRTFPNSCQAANAGYRVIYHSECLARDQSGSTGGQNGSGGAGTMGPGSGATASGKSCSRAFVPVCGSRGGKKKTFINACMAASEGYRVSGQGRCE